MTERYALVNAKLAVALGDTGKATTPMAVAQAKLNDAWEQIAVTVGPALEAFFSWLIGTLGTLIGVVTTVAGVVGTVLGPVFEQIGLEVGHVADAIGFVSDVLGNLAKGVGVATGAIGGALTSTGSAVTTFSGKAQDDLDAVSNATHDLQGKARDDLVARSDSVTSSFTVLTEAGYKAQQGLAIAMNRMKKVAKDVTDAIVADATAVIRGYFDPLETRSALFDTRQQLLADREALRKAKNKTDSHKAKNAIIADLDAEETTLVKLGSQHALTAKDVATYTRNAKADYKSLGKDAQKHINEVIAALKRMAGLSPPNATFSMVFRGGNAYTGGGGHAAGGRETAGVPRLVGEQGPEWFVPDSNGTTYPHGTSPGMGTINITHRTILQLDGSTLIDYVERHLGLRLDLRGTSTGMGNV